MDDGARAAAMWARMPMYCPSAGQTLLCRCFLALFDLLTGGVDIESRSGKRTFQLDTKMLE